MIFVVASLGTSELTDPQEIDGLESGIPIHLRSMCFGRRSVVNRGISYSEVVFDLLA